MYTRVVLKSKVSQVQRTAHFDVALRDWQCTKVWVTTSFVKCDSSPSCEIQEKLCDKMEMEGGMSGA